MFGCCSVERIATSRSTSCDADAAELEALRARFPSTEQPCVPAHPVTERPVLFVSESFTSRVVNVSESESQELLQELADAAHAEERESHETPTRCPRGIGRVLLGPCFFVAAQKLSRRESMQRLPIDPSARFEPPP